MKQGGCDNSLGIQWQHVIAVIGILMFRPTVSAQTDTVFIRYDRLPLRPEQVYHTDTVLISPRDHNWLIGTTVLEGSRLNTEAANHGYFIKRLTLTPCSEPEVNLKPNHVVTQEGNTGGQYGTLLLHINVIGNCCNSFLGEIEIVQDSILNLVHSGYGESCFCHCCFGLAYEISTSLSGRKKATHVMINRDIETLTPICAH